MTKKARNTFEQWQEANQLRRENIIDEYLMVLGKTKVKVKNPTYLAELVARYLTQVEGKPCNKATLLRNDRYKARLLAFQAGSLSPGAKALSARKVTDPTAKALITGAQLESSNLKRELERLNIYVTTLEEQVDQFRSQGRLLPRPDETTDSLTRVTDHELQFIRTCQALRSVLSHFNLVVEVDAKNNRILDKSRRRDNVIADAETATPFFEWLGRVSGGQTV